ncbi:FUSC family protein [Ktedonospora formicarum]|uniref:Integral membrane bound transporter domain-containing protein n=1 Tax=Ktedonospora formicarum TaxID=2778364 RepID=A0A8J3I879_9CHLR|nr:FUSC family protein [Ktedonospora formicarum]GHO47179.1 hypothetical protein KSX_53420 [Ktedonospora formicarum]
MGRMGVLFHNNSGAKLYPGKGFYTALAMFLPLLVLTILGQRSLGILVMTGALLTSFGDVGTSPRTQAWSLGTIAVGGALITALGRLIGGPWWVEIVEIFLMVFLSGLLSVYGQAAAVVGLLLTITFVISLANRSGSQTSLPAAGGFLLGGVILMLFMLLFAWLQSHRSRMRNEVRSNRPQPRRTTLTAQFTLPPPLLRFSLLRAVGAAVAAGSGWILGEAPFYWATLTVIICTQQDQKVSLRMALQNVIATFLGAFLAAVLIGSVQNALVVGLIVVASTFLAFAIKELNYFLHLFFFTILILLLISIKMSGQSLAVWRVVTILVGAGIVLVITFLSQMPSTQKRTVSS